MLPEQQVLCCCLPAHDELLHAELVLQMQDKTVAEYGLSLTHYELVGVSGIPQYGIYLRCQVGW